jgi:hypothetical protein
MLIKFAQLKIRDCHWPVAEADGEVLFCGEPAENGCPYCAAHTAIAHHPAGRRRIFAQRRAAAPATQLAEPRRLENSIEPPAKAE